MRLALRMALVFLGVLLLAGCHSGSGDPRPGPAPVSTSAAGDPVTITRYDADFSVAVSGPMTVVETLTLDVSTDDRHGIFRYFADGTVADFGATLDGATTPVQESEADGQVTFKIGDPAQTLAIGTHVVRTRYVVPQALRTDPSGHAVLDRDLVPDDWELAIDAADLTVHLSAPADGATCTVGPDPCDVEGLGTDTLHIDLATLPDHAAVHLRASVDTTVAG